MSRKCAVWSFAAVCALIAIGCAGANGSSAGQQASQLCIERARNTNLAILMYATDYDDVLPPGVAWMDEVTPYVFPLTVNFMCPVLEQQGPGLYGFALHTQVLGQPVNSFADPSAVVTVFEVASTAKNVVGTEADLLQTPRHAGVVTVARLDGSSRGESP